MQGQGAGTGVTTGRGSKGRCKGSRALVCLDISSYLQLTANNRCKPFCFTAGLVSREGSYGQQTIISSHTTVTCSHVTVSAFHLIYQATTGYKPRPCGAVYLYQLQV